MQHLFEHPAHPIQLIYPNPTPAGFPVVIHEKETPVGQRFHFISENSDEIYFEISRYPNLPLQHCVDRFVTEIGRPELGTTRSATTEITLLGLTGVQFTVDFPENRRLITFLTHQNDTLRIILNPHSPLNFDMLDSMHLRITH